MNASLNIAFFVLSGVLSVSLLQDKADAQHTAREADTTLALAVASKNVGKERLLLSRGANANARNSYGVSLLMVACGNEDETSVNVLLAHGAKVNARDPNGKTALHYAALYGLSASDEGDFESQGDVSKCCPILSVMRLLIRHHANVNAIANDGRTPLMLVAAFAQSPNCTRLLLENGAKLQPKDKNSRSAFDWAVWGSEKDSLDPNDAEVVALLKRKR